MRLAFFASHGGSSMKEIVSACRGGQLKADACVMFSNNPGSKALNWAKENALEAHAINDSAFKEKKEQTDFILTTLKEHAVTHICLSGYMKLIPEDILRAYPNRIINIHPALLPAYGGKGMYGLNVHKAVLDNQERQTGITLHLVNEHYDEGEIIAQKEVSVDGISDPETLQKKVGALEPAFYVSTLQKIQSQDIDLDKIAASPLC